jgi:hypothetical protein
VPDARTNRRRGHAEKTAQTSWAVGPQFASLIPGIRHHEFLENDGTLEAAHRIAGHTDSRTTKLYDRRGQKVLLEDMERNAELGISFRGLNRFAVCSGSRFQE